jgi:hypothetical protein
MRWHALARAAGQTQVASSNSAVSHVLHDMSVRDRDWHIHKRAETVSDLCPGDVMLVTP